MSAPSITVAVPSYNRAAELRELLQSFVEARALPDELLIVEDHSPERPAIRATVRDFVTQLAARSCTLRLAENPLNLGYDGNVRTAIRESSSEWVMLLGNDDVISSDGIAFTRDFLAANPTTQMVSRTFFRFADDWKLPIGLSRIQSTDKVFSYANSHPSMAFRLCGFVGGLVINRTWANALATDRYDGTLYYQLYLAFNAYCDGGIGYISRTVVGGRAGNTPLFGSAQAERSLHLPGAYRPKARAHMWSSVMRIATDVGRSKGVELEESIRHELDTRQSFHVFEMMATSPRAVLKELRDELLRVGLHRSAQSKTFFWINYLLGPRSIYVYRLVRRIAQ